MNTQGRVYLIALYASTIKAVVANAFVGNYSFEYEIYNIYNRKKKKKKVSQECLFLFIYYREGV